MMPMSVFQREKIRREAKHWGLFYDVHAIDLTPQQLELARQYSKKYCRKCRFNFACCYECFYLTECGCRLEEIPEECVAFLCSFILKKIPKKDREVLITFTSLLPINTY